jgi:hypothetical protein
MNKITYGVKVNGKEFKECDNIKEAERLGNELTHRRSGRTTRMFLQGITCGERFNDIAFVFKNMSIAKHFIPVFRDILNKLDIPYIQNIENNTITITKTTYSFIDTSLYITSTKNINNYYKEWYETTLYIKDHTFDE